MLARPARRATYHRALRSGELIPQNERELRRSEGSGTITELWGAEKLGRSEGSGMLIGDPLVEGSSASSTDGELWRAENSFLGMRGTQLPMRSSRAENSLLRVRPITSSGEWRTHSSEWEGTPPLRRERQAQPWALESGELIPQNERELRRSAGSGMLKGDPLMRGAMLALPITRSGERRTHSSEWEELSYQWGALERRTHSSEWDL